MSETPNVTAISSYLKTLYDGVNYATEHDEVFEFLVSVTVVASQLVNKYPEVANRLNSAIEKVAKSMQPPVTH